MVFFFKAALNYRGKRLFMEILNRDMLFFNRRTERFIEIKCKMSSRQIRSRILSSRRNLSLQNRIV